MGNFTIMLQYLFCGFEKAIYRIKNCEKKKIVEIVEKYNCGIVEKYKPI